MPDKCPTCLLFFEKVSFHQWYPHAPDAPCPRTSAHPWSFAPSEVLEYERTMAPAPGTDELGLPEACQGCDGVFGAKLPKVYDGPAGKYCRDCAPLPAVTPR